MEKNNKSIIGSLSKEEYYQFFFNYIEQFFEYNNKTLTGLTFDKNKGLLIIKTYNQELIEFLYYNYLATPHRDTPYDNIELVISKKHICVINMRPITTAEMFMYKIMEFLNSKLENYEIMVGCNNNTDYIDFRQIQTS